jgi:hypothetical protein
VVVNVRNISSSNYNCWTGVCVKELLCRKETLADELEIMHSVSINSLLRILPAQPVYIKNVV